MPIARHIYRFPLARIDCLRNDRVIDLTLLDRMNRQGDVLKSFVFHAPLEEQAHGYRSVRHKEVVFVDFAPVVGAECREALRELMDLCSAVNVENRWRYEISANAMADTDPSASRNLIKNPQYLCHNNISILFI